MCYAHQVIIYYVCKIVCRISVRFDKNHIIKLCIIYCDISVNLILKCGCALCRVVLSDDIWLAGREICLNLLL